MKVILDRIKIPAQLKNYVAYVYSNSTINNFPDIELPDGLPEVLFIIDGGIKKRPLSSTEKPNTISQSSIIDLQEDACMTTNLGNLNSIGIKFTPIGFYLFLSSLGILKTNKLISISEIKNKFLSTLNNEILLSKNSNEAILILEKFFENIQLKFKEKESDTTALLSDCITLIKASKGTIKKNQLAKKVSISTDNLETYFQDYLGVSIEKLIAILKIATEDKIKPFEPILDEISISDLMKDVLKK
ncbi:hypothetical protein H0I23_12930 [Cellulophaga sp. HaHaR_3_176]|uniref:hypothetical protein n=1 Tax=Cellulophaga sp. HaHaR_3_176 TaxID=1942464 RepID=UPI001C1F4135|nr:hypothetical protein [Cellulophaga sp. HaHaR_3_176]QWX83350.1 hypothetical protein H0I23_12930 [Cellulophaga sp. HaHaR_3_176]